MTKIFCDICGKEINDMRNVSVFKMKKLVCSWQECRWERLTIHNDCWRNLASLIAQRKDKTID